MSMLSDVLTELIEDRKKADPFPIRSSMKIQRVPDKGIAYSERHRGQWYRPEYDFKEIQIAESRDGYVSRSILKKVNRLIVAGFDFVGNNPETVRYVRERLNRMAWATGKPFPSLLWTLWSDLARFNNCIWVKVRDSDKSEGDTREDVTGTEIDPVAGYFVLPFETLQFKAKPNGELKKVLQKMPSGRMKEFHPRDIIHFYTNKKPGFSVGSPELLPAIDDIAILRRIEENVEDLIESELFPTYQYKIGTEDSPARYGPDGRSEIDIVKREVEYIPAGGILVTDHRTEVAVIGSEGEALRIDYYINHFKNRALAALGTSSLDMGEGTGATKSTASTLSKGMLLDIEALAIQVKEMIEFYVISEIMLEGGYDPFSEEDKVFIRFGVIDKDERRADENQQIQLFSNNVRTMDEVRQSLGDSPFEENHLDRTHYKMFAEPTNLIKAMGAGTAASETLAESPSSNISPEAVKKEQQYAEKLEKQKIATKKAGQTGRPKSKSSGLSSNLSRPANQHGRRSSPKTTKDIEFFDGTLYEMTCDFDINDDRLLTWKNHVWDRYKSFNGEVSLESIASSMEWRLKDNG